MQTQRLYGFAFCLGLALLFGTMVSSLLFMIFSVHYLVRPISQKLGAGGLACCFTCNTPG